MAPLFWLQKCRKLTHGRDVQDATKEDVASAETAWLVRQFAVMLSNHTEKKWEKKYGSMSGFPLHTWVFPQEEWGQTN